MNIKNNTLSPIKVTFKTNENTERIKLSLFERSEDCVLKRIYSKTEIEKKTQENQLRDRITEWFERDDGYTDLIDGDDESFTGEEPIITGCSIAKLEEGDNEESVTFLDIDIDYRSGEKEAFSDSNTTSNELIKKDQKNDNEVELLDETDINDGCVQ